MQGQIAEYAKLSNVSKVVLGRTNHKILFGQTKGTLADHVAQYAPKLDIYIIPDIENGGTKRKEVFTPDTAEERERNRRLLWKGSEGDCVKCFLALAVSTGFGMMFQHFQMSESILSCSIFWGFF